MNDARFQGRLDEFAELIDEELVRLIESEAQVPNLHEGMVYSMGLDVGDRRVRGKRIRPALCLFTVDALGGELGRAVSFAVAIELLHNFALIHDDIQDGDTLRRGRPCTHLKFGIPHAINIGDYMLAKVFSTVWRDPRQSLAVREQLIQLINRTLDDIFVGQSLDISARGSSTFTMADYELVVSKKTGSYLAAPMIGGAIVAEADEDVILALEKFGHAIGPLFQIKDDLIDLTTGKGRDEIGSDIREGKRSYLVAAVSEVCSDGERAELFAILDKPREQTSAEDVQRAIEIFRRHGVMERAEAHCEALRMKGMEAIRGTPPELRETLESIAGLLAARTT